MRPRLTPVGGALVEACLVLGWPVGMVTCEMARPLKELLAFWDAIGLVVQRPDWSNPFHDDRDVASCVFTVDGATTWLPARQVRRLPKWLPEEPVGLAAHICEHLPDEFPARSIVSTPDGEFWTFPVPNPIGLLRSGTPVKATHITSTEPSGHQLMKLDALLQASLPFL